MLLLTHPRPNHFPTTLTIVKSSAPQNMEGLSPPLKSRDQLPVRKSSILKTGQRRVSCVTFGENNIIEIEKREETIEKEDKENDDKLGKIKEDKQHDENGNHLFVKYCLTPF